MKCVWHNAVCCDAVIKAFLNRKGIKCGIIPGHFSDPHQRLHLFFNASFETCAAFFKEESFTSTHVAVVWLVTRLAAAAADGHHPLSVSVTVQLYGHVHLLGVGDATTPSDDQ